MSDSVTCVNELNNKELYYCCFAYAPRSYITAAHTLATHVRNGNCDILDNAFMDDNFCNRFLSDTEKTPLLSRGLSDLNNLCNYFCFAY